MLSIGMAVKPPRQQSLVQQAISALRRLGATSLYVPDDLGLVLGPELVTNGDFSAGTTGWTQQNASIAAAGGELTVTGSGGVYPSAVSQNFTLTAGVVYRLSGFLALGTNTDSARLVVQNTGSVNQSSQLTVTTTTSTFASTTFSVSTTGSYKAVVFIGSATGSGTVKSRAVSVREILSATTYTDSTGQTPVTAIGDLVGLLTDRRYGAANLGVELSPGLSSAAGWAFVQPTSGSVAISGGAIRVNSVDGSYCNARFNPTLPVVGRLYRYELEVSSYTGVANIGTVGSGSVPIPSGAGRKILYFVADATIGFEVKRGGVCDITITSFSVREVLGNNASQATTASKPVLTRVPKRLGPNRVSNGAGDSSVGWTGATGVWTGTVSSVGGALRIYATGTTSGWGGAISTLTGLTIGKTYTLSGDFVGQTGWTTFSQAVIGVLDGGTAVVNLANRPTAGSFTPATFVATNTSLTVRIRAEGTPNGAASTADFDNISVREVLEWTPALKFDGSNDLMTLSSGAILQQGSDHFVTAAFVLDAVGGQQGLYTCSSTASDTPLVCDLEVTAAGAIQAFWRDDSNTARTITASVLSVGVPYVATAALIGTTRYLWLNGTLVGTNVQGALGATAVGTATVGALIRTTTQFYLNGKIIDIALGQSTLTEADRKLIERNMAQRAGVAYVG